MNSTNYLASNKMRSAPEILDEDMRPSDIVDILKRLKFEEQFRPIWVDSAVRDFLLSAVTAMRRK